MFETQAATDRAPSAESRQKNTVDLSVGSAALKVGFGAACKENPFWFRDFDSECPELENTHETRTRPRFPEGDQSLSDRASFADRIRIRRRTLTKIMIFLPIAQIVCGEQYLRPVVVSIRCAECRQSIFVGSQDEQALLLQHRLHLGSVSVVMLLNEPETDHLKQVTIRLASAEVQIAAFLCCPN
jgi:hypothetical protein